MYRLKMKAWKLFHKKKNTYQNSAGGGILICVKVDSRSRIVERYEGGTSHIDKDFINNSSRRYDNLPCGYTQK
jgi:hypothetical protein